MAKKNINEAEKTMIKKRYTVGIIIASALVGLGVLVAGTSILGFISAFASVIAGAVSIGAGIAVGINAHLRKKNKLASLNKQAQENRQVEVKENKEEAQKVEVKQDEEQKQVNREQLIQEIREKNRVDEAGPNTFSVKEENGETLCKDAKDRPMIYKINDKNERDVRKIIPSLTANELRQKAKYVISICDGAGQVKDVQISANTFERDMNVVYSNIADVRKQLQQVKEEVMVQ